MATKKKMLQASAGNAGGDPVVIEDVFSTYLYAGNQTARSIVNDIDLDGEGGLVWLKSRTEGQNNYLFDTARGPNKFLMSDHNAGEQVVSDRGVTAFNSNGFDLGSNTGGNRSANNYVSWTFRKAPKFFDIVTYTGNGVAGRDIAHELGVAPGMIVVKIKTASIDWIVYHRGIGATKNLRLNQTNVEQTYIGMWNDTEPTDTVFTLGSTASVNAAGNEYVAYLYAHDPLGPAGDGSDGMIACGSYTGNSSTDGPEIDLGWEPQWILVKNADVARGWFLFDSMRGMRQRLAANDAAAEATTASDTFALQATGFKVTASDLEYNRTGDNYVYMAIRRGPMRTPEVGTKVFAVDQNTSSAPEYISGFPVDMSFHRNVTGIGNSQIQSRLLQGTRMFLNRTDAEIAGAGCTFDYMNGWGLNNANLSSYYSWMWKRSPGFFDVVAYTGEGTFNTTTITRSHSLGVVPEMIIYKGRDAAYGWAVYHEGIAVANALQLTNAFASSADGSIFWNGTPPTATEFSAGKNPQTNNAGADYIAYLFATLAGVSKVGSYTGNGSNQTIDCGFTSGARFILIKRTDATGDWYFWDSVRGIVAGNDPHLSLNTTTAQVTTDDSVDPDSSGFIVNQVAATNINVSSAEYIFYAIA